MVYSEPWDIQNHEHIHNPVILRTPVYSERWHFQNPRHIQNPVKPLQWSALRKELTAVIIFTSFNHFRSIRLPRSLLYKINIIPADTDVFRTSLKRHDVLRPNQMSLGRLEKDAWFTTSWRRLIYVVSKTSNLWRLEDVDLWRLEDAWFKTSWRRLFYVFLRTSNLQRLKDVRFTSSWGRPLYDVFKTSDFRHLEDVWFQDVLFTSSWRCPVCDVLKTPAKRRLCTTSVFYTTSKEMFFSLFCAVWNIQKILSVPI